MNTMTRMLCCLLIVSMSLLSMTAARADMISTADVLTANGAGVGRAALLAAIERPQIADKLHALGVDLSLAKQRVAALTDEEVRTLAGNVEAAPAGGIDAIFIVVLAIVLYLIYYKWIY